ALGPLAVGAERPGERVSGHVDVEDLLEPGAQVVVCDRRESLHAAVEVAGHEVGRADEVEALGARAEAVDPGVLEIAADDRTHSDVLRKARRARTQAAD